MKKLRDRLITCGCLAFFFFALWQVGLLDGKNDPTFHVLLIGNDLTSAGNMPAMLEDIATAKQTPIKVHTTYYRYIRPNARLSDHVQSVLTRFQLRQRKWDVVIFQERSVLSALDMIGVEQESFQYARRFVEEIRHESPRTNIIFIENWASKSGDKWSCRWLPNNCTYEGMQYALTENQQRLAEETETWLAPVGEVWQLIRTESPALSLYEADELSPSPAGSYATACTLYRTVFQKPVAGAPDLGIKSADAAYIQQVVDQMPLEETEK